MRLRVCSGRRGRAELRASVDAGSRRGGALISRCEFHLGAASLPLLDPPTARRCAEEREQPDSGESVGTAMRPEAAAAAAADLKKRGKK